MAAFDFSLCDVFADAPLVGNAGLAPDFARLAALLSAVGVCCLSAGEADCKKARMFAPGHGVVEDAARTRPPARRPGRSPRS